MIVPYLLNMDSKVVCAHGGDAVATVTNPRVKVDGAAVVTLAGPYAITCKLSPAPGVTPCATGTWLVGAARVKVGGQPVLLQTSTSTSVPNATPMTVTKTQSKVQGQ